MSQRISTHRNEDTGIRPAAYALRRPLCALLIAGQLAGCASTADEGFASQPGPEPESKSSAAVTIASAAGAGALVGLAATGEIMSGCSGDGCAYLLGFALLLIPVAAVIGAGIGVAKAALDNEREDLAAKDNYIRSGGPCPDPRAAKWLEDCSTAQGLMPPPFLPSPDRSEAVPNAKFHAWFDACGIAVEQQLQTRIRRVVPQVCRRDPVPTPDRVLCMQRSAAAEQEARLDRLLFAAQRAKLEHAASGQCSL
jgi:hypothetical protein